MWYRFLAHGIAACWAGCLPLVSGAQLSPAIFNPGDVWAYRLEPVGAALYLPPSQQGLQQATTYLLYQGQRYLMQSVHYDAQGRLTMQQEYRLVVVAGQLTRQIAHQLTYHTQVVGDSLTSEVEEQRFVGKHNYPLTWSVTGNLPPTEPLLGTGTEAHQLRLTTAGQMRTTINNKTHSWTWTQQGTLQGGPPPSQHSISGFLDTTTRQFTARASQSGASTQWQRRYRGRSQHYIEECHTSFRTAGGGELLNASCIAE